MWLQLEQLVLSHPPLFARKPLTNVFLGQLEISLCLCVSLSTHSQEHFSIFHFGTTSRLFNSSLTVPRADAPGGVHLQLLLSEHLNLATLGQSFKCHQLPWLGCFPDTDQLRMVEDSDALINLSSFGWGPTSHRNQPSERAIHRCCRHKRSWSSSLEPLCSCCNKCVCKVCDSFMCLNYTGIPALLHTYMAK